MAKFKLTAFLALYRWDVAIISFFSYLIGVLLAREITFFDFLPAALISMVSMNFIYSFNSWADRKIDQINKPKRPIPSGLLKPKEAFYYSFFLLFLSISYPFILFNSLHEITSFLLFPLIGLMYSAEPFRLKKNFLLSVIATSLIVMLPILLGHFLNAENFYAVPFFTGLFFYCLSIIPFKDIEDSAGDSHYDCKNWFKLLGKKLFIFSIFGLLFALAFILFFPVSILTVYLSVLITGTLLIIFGFIFFKKNINKLYKAIILFVVLLAIAFFALQLTGLSEHFIGVVKNGF